MFGYRVIKDSEESGKPRQGFKSYGTVFAPSPADPKNQVTNFLQGSAAFSNLVQLNARSDGAHQAVVQAIRNCASLSALSDHLLEHQPTNAVAAAANNIQRVLPSFFGSRMTVNTLLSALFVEVKAEIDRVAIEINNEKKQTLRS